MVDFPSEISFPSPLSTIAEEHNHNTNADDDYTPHEERWSRERIQEAIRVWNLSGQESEQLRSLQHKLVDIDHDKNNPHDLVRFLRGPQGPVQAEEIFRSMIQWRKEFGTDQLLNGSSSYKPPPILHDFIPSAMLQGVDHEGDSVYIERPGAIDALGLARRFQQDELVKHTVWLRELCDSGAWKQEYEQQHGHKPRNMTIVFDLQGLNSSHLKKEVIPLFQAITSYTANKYYGVTKRTIIIRAPAIFRMVWRVAKQFYRAEVQKKIVFASNDYLNTLEKYMNIDILPPCIHPQGHGTTARGFPPRLEGGTIPQGLTLADDVSKSSETQSLYGKNGSGSFDSTESNSDSNQEARTTMVTVSCKQLLKGSFDSDDTGCAINLNTMP